MPRLYDLDLFRTKIGEIDIDDINSLLGTSLDLVTAPIESLLQTRFKYGVYQDIFSPILKYAHMQDYIFEVRLSSGFLSAVDPFKIYTAASAEDLLTVEERTDLNYSVDYENGIVRFLGGIPAMYLKIEYTSGLPEIDDDDTWDEDDVPLWLRNIALAYARAVYQRMIWLKAQDTTKQRKPLEIKLNAPADIELLAMKHIRWFPTYLKPTYTVKV